MAVEDAFHVNVPDDRIEKVQTIADVVEVVGEQQQKEVSRT